MRFKLTNEYKLAGAKVINKKETSDSRMKINKCPSTIFFSYNFDNQENTGKPT